MKWTTMVSPLKRSNVSRSFTLHAQSELPISSNDTVHLPSGFLRHIPPRAASPPSRDDVLRTVFSHLASGLFYRTYVSLFSFQQLFSCTRVSYLCRPLPVCFHIFHPLASCVVPVPLPYPVIAEKLDLGGALVLTKAIVRPVLMVHARRLW